MNKPATNNITIGNIANQLKISTSTVSRALNNNPLISEPVRKKIHTLAKKLNYQPNVIARKLALQRNRTIGYIGSGFTTPFYTPIFEVYQSEMIKRNYHFFISNSGFSNETEHECISTFVKDRVEGIIVDPLQYDTANIKELKLTGIPFVMLDKPINGTKADYVNCDDMYGAYKLVEYLIVTGCKRIVYIGFRKFAGVSSDLRYNGFVKALSSAGLRLDNDLLFEITQEKNLVEEGYRITGEILRQTRPDAIFAFNDLAAIGVIRRLKEENIKIPAEISVAGFDDIEFAEYIEIPLTTVRLPVRELAHRSVEILFNKIENKTTNQKYHEISLPTELVVRSSTK
jgi:DNA-binding LacI/PurR family transcriptional regulator